MFDDKPNIVESAGIRLFDGSFSSLIDASTGGISSPLGRPLSVASFALNLYFFGEHPFSFKLVNLAIHLINGILIFILTCQLWPRLTAQRAHATALLVTALWLLHPINLTPVLFVVQRMTSLSAFFMLAALCLYLYGRSAYAAKRYRACIAIAASLLVCWPAAVLSKETGVLLPLFIFLCEWLALNSLQAIPRRTAWSAALMVIVATAALAAMKWDFLTGGYAGRDFGLLERLMTEARVLWFYLLQLFFPWPDFFSLHHDDIAISRSLLSPPQTLLSIVAGILLTVFAIVRRTRTTQYRLFAFAVAWFLIAHMLESTILPLEIAYEHRNYLASFGMLMWLSSIVLSDPTPQKLALRTLGICFAVFCGIVTMQRAHQWGNEYLRTQMEATTHPGSARANYEAALAIIDRTPLAAEKARFYFERAAALDPHGKDALLGMLYLDCLTGTSKNTKNIALQAKLRERFAQSHLAPGDRGVIHSLSSLLVEQRLCLQDDEVKALLDAALSNPQATGEIKGMLYAVAMDYAVAKIGSIPHALAYAKAAVKSDPQSVVLRINLIQLLSIAGDKAESKRQYSELTGLQIAPRHRAIVKRLHQTLERMEENANTR